MFVYLFSFLLAREAATSFPIQSWATRWLLCDFSNFYFLIILFLLFFYMFMWQPTAFLSNQGQHVGYYVINLNGFTSYCIHIHIYIYINMCIYIYTYTHLLAFYVSSIGGQVTHWVTRSLTHIIEKHYQRVFLETFCTMCIVIWRQFLPILSIRIQPLFSISFQKHFNCHIWKLYYGRLSLNLSITLKGEEHVQKVLYK